MAKTSAPAKQKNTETAEERKARHEAACADAREKLGRASAAEVAEHERRAVAESDAAKDAES